MNRGLSLMSRVCFWNTINNKCSIFRKDCNRQLGGGGGGVRRIAVYYYISKTVFIKKSFNFKFPVFILHEFVPGCH